MSHLVAQLQATPAPSCGVAKTVTLGTRAYILRAPLEPCRPSGAPLPLMLLIHCFGCDAASEIQKYSEAADAHGFVLAAPEGYHNSWNAPHCCGPAREENYDDVGFIDAVVKHSGSLLPIAPDAIFTAGFSNGGFMSSHLAWSGTTRWAGISPASGHEYSVNADRPLPVYIHHCGADNMVKMAGCCAEPEDGAPCCCDIGSQRKTCVATASLFEQVVAWPSPMRTLSLPLPLAHPSPTPRVRQVALGPGSALQYISHEFGSLPSFLRRFPHDISLRRAGALQPYACTSATPRVQLASSLSDS